MVGQLSATQREGLRRLVHRGVLTEEQESAVRAEIDGAARSPRRGGLWEVLGYVGAALVLGGAGLLLQMSWEDLGRPVRVGILAAVTLLLGGVGIFLAGGVRQVRTLAGESATRRRIVAALFALGACTAAMATGASMDQWWLIGAGAVGFLVAVAGYLALPSVPGLLVSGYFSVHTVLWAIEQWWPESSTAPVTIALILLGTGWLLLAWFDRLVSREVGLAGGAAILLVGGQWPLGSGTAAWGYGLTLLIALGCFAAYMRRPDLPLLVAGVLGVTIAVPEAVWDITGGAIGAPFVVLLVGFVLLAAGAIGLRLRKAVTRDES